MARRRRVGTKRAGCKIVLLKTGAERPVSELSIGKRECIRWNSQGGAFRIEFVKWPFCEASDRVTQTAMGRRFIIDVDPGGRSSGFTIHISGKTTYRIVALGPGVSAVKPPSTGPAVVGGD